MKKIDIERWFEKGVYLLKNGDYILVTSVTPFNKFHDDIDSRTIEYFVGKVHRDGNKFNADAVAAGFAEDDGTEQLGFIIDFDTSGTEMCSLRHANMRFATFLGIMSDVSFARICSAHE